MARRDDFNATWILGGPINAENETVFFVNPLDPAENGTTGVSDVLHYTYTQDSNGFGHLDGFVISDVTGSLSIADLNAASIVATLPFVDETHPEVFDFSNTNITAKFQSDVPEIDAASGGAAIALLLGVLALVSERRGWRASGLAG